MLILSADELQHFKRTWPDAYRFVVRCELRGELRRLRNGNHSGSREYCARRQVELEELNNQTQFMEEQLDV